MGLIYRELVKIIGKLQGAWKNSGERGRCKLWEIRGKLREIGGNLWGI